MISVVIPTYRRPELLKRAIASVFAQTYQDWELLISDDEEPPGQAWADLGELARRDARVRVLRNPGAHGQAPNMNHLLTQARGQWIKPLYDDDVLRPRCLEVFAKAVEGQESVAIATCLALHYFNNQYQRVGRRTNPGVLELVPGAQALLGLYLKSCPAGIPTQVMVRKRCVTEGALFELWPGIHGTVDIAWTIGLLQRGDLLLINLPLIEQHQGGHETQTTLMSEDQLDAEFEVLARRLATLVDPALHPPPLATVLEMLALIRALHRLTIRRPLDAMRLACRVRRPRAVLLALRWLLQQLLPGRVNAVKSRRLPADHLPEVCAGGG